MRFFARPALLVATALMLLAAMPARSAPCPSQLQLPSQPDPIPRDDADICGSRGLDTFAHMAWQTFRYLVWPTASRGVADGTARIGGSLGVLEREPHSVGETVGKTLLDRLTCPVQHRCRGHTRMTDTERSGE